MALLRSMVRAFEKSDEQFHGTTPPSHASVAGPTQQPERRSKGPDARPPQVPVQGLGYPEGAGYLSQRLIQRIYMTGSGARTMEVLARADPLAVGKVLSQLDQMPAWPDSLHLWIPS